MLQCKTSRQDQAISSSSGSSPTINRPEPQRCGTPTADSPIVVAGPNVPQRLSPPTTDGRDRCLRGCEERATTYSVPASYRPGPVGKQAMTRCLLRRGPLHCTPLTAAALRCRTPPLLPVGYVHCMPAQDGAKGIQGPGVRVPLTYVHDVCQLPAGCVSRCAHDAARRCPQGGPAPARPPET